MLIYGIFYLVAFFWLEGRETTIHLIKSGWDLKIPFCEYFVIPYFLWFVQMAAAFIYFLFYCVDDGESRRFCLSFCSGMTIFLVVSYFYPTGHELRPQLEGDSIFIMLVKFLYQIDTPTNILPSMHVYVTVANSIAFCRQENLRRRQGFTAGLLICSALIIASTLFLKQHSIVDVVCALALNAVCYVCIYILYPLCEEHLCQR